MVVDFSFFFVSKKVSLFWLKWKKAEAIVSRPRFGFGEAEARPALESLLFYGIEEVVDMKKVKGSRCVPFQSALHHVPPNCEWKRFQSSHIECDVSSLWETDRRKQPLGEVFDMELLCGEQLSKLQQRPIELSVKEETECREQLLPNPVSGMMKALIAHVGMNGEVPKMAHPFHVTSTHRQERPVEEKGVVLRFKEEGIEKCGFSCCTPWIHPSLRLRRSRS